MSAAITPLEPARRGLGFSIRARVAMALKRLLLPNPTGDPHARHSMVGADHGGTPSERLLDVAIDAVRAARAMDLSDITARMTTTPRWPEIWPGEHYRLLAGLVATMKPMVVIEIGTYQGLSALTLSHHLPAGGRLHTFDVAAWNTVAGTVLRPADFESGRIVAEVADLTGSAVFESHRTLMESAELIFVDAAKDGRMEQVLLDRLETVRFRRPPIVVFDDIRLWNMLGIWRRIRRPKLDLVSFGHWSGTGLIDWQPVAS